MNGYIEREILHTHPENHDLVFQLSGWSGHDRSLRTTSPNPKQWHANNRPKRPRKHPMFQRQAPTLKYQGIVADKGGTCFPNHIDSSTVCLIR